MNWIIITGVTVFVCLIFTVLGWWQRAIEMAEDHQTAEAIRKAEDEGANKALTQHPQIDITRCFGCGSCAAACPEHGVLAVVEGKARLVSASYCVGHGCCEKACPVGALTVGLGDLSGRADIPLLTDEHETSVPNVFITGELGGIGLIRHAIVQGTEVVETVAARLRDAHGASDSDGTVDLLIVGCGPSGIAAALRAHELHLNFIIIDQDDIGGTVRKYPRNKMTLTQPVELPVYGRMKRTQYSKEELIKLWEDIFMETGISVRAGVKFNHLAMQEGGLLLAETSAETILCRHCILAMGRRGTPRTLGIPGEDSEKVLYQLIDAAEHTHESILIIGGGDSAIEAALALATQPGNRIVLSYRRNAFFRIKPRNRELLEAAREAGTISVVLNSSVEAIAKDHAVLSIMENDNDDRHDTIPYDYIYIFAGGEPPYPLLERSGVVFSNDKGKVEDETMVKTG